MVDCRELFKTREMENSELNFSWVIVDKLAGCAGPVLDGDLEFLVAKGIRVLVSLASSDEGVHDRDDIESKGIEAFIEPIPDFEAPKIEQIKRVIQFINKSLANGKPVAVSCGAGYGRTGTILSCYFVYLGLTADEAISKVRSTGRCSFETENQYNSIKQYAQLRGNQSAK